MGLLDDLKKTAEEAVGGAVLGQMGKSATNSKTTKTPKSPAKTSGQNVLGEEVQSIISGKGIDKKAGLNALKNLIPGTLDDTIIDAVEGSMQ